MSCRCLHLHLRPYSALLENTQLGTLTLKHEVKDQLASPQARSAKDSISLALLSTICTGSVGSVSA